MPSPSCKTSAFSSVYSSQVVCFGFFSNSLSQSNSLSAFLCLLSCLVFTHFTQVLPPLSLAQCVPSTCHWLPVFDTSHGPTAYHIPRSSNAQKALEDLALASLPTTPLTSKSHTCQTRCCFFSLLPCPSILLSPVLSQHTTSLSLVWLQAILHSN